jgi:hypothetical protein
MTLSLLKFYFRSIIGRCPKTPKLFAKRKTQN